MPHRHHKSFRRKTELQKQFVVKVPNFLTLISRVDLHFVCVCSSAIMMIIALEFCSDANHASR